MKLSPQPSLHASQASAEVPLSRDLDQLGIDRDQVEGTLFDNCPSAFAESDAVSKVDEEDEGLAAVNYGEGGYMKFLTKCRDFRQMVWEMKRDGLCGMDVPSY